MFLPSRSRAFRLSLLGLCGERGGGPGRGWLPGRRGARGRALGIHIYRQIHTLTYDYPKTILQRCGTATMIFQSCTGKVIFTHFGVEQSHKLCNYSNMVASVRNKNIYTHFIKASAQTTYNKYSGCRFELDLH